MQNEQFSLTVMAKDAGTPARNSTVGVVVNVKTGSSKPPTWDMDYNSRTYTVGPRERERDRERETERQREREKLKEREREREKLKEREVAERERERS